MRQILVRTTVPSAIVLLATACGSSGSPQSAPTTTPSSTAPSTSAPESPTAASSAAAAVVASSTTAGMPAVTGTVTDSQGDRLLLTMSVGQPTTLANAADPVAHDCDSGIQSGNTTVSQAVVYPVDVTETLESSVAANVTLSFIQDFVAATATLNVNAGVNPLAPSYPFAGPSAGSMSGNGDCGTGTVQWQNQAPNQTETWDGYLVVTGAITPNDPTGMQQSAGPLLLRPGLSVGGNAVGDFAIDTAASANLVQCPNADGSGLATYISMDVQYALASGCKR